MTAPDALLREALEHLLLHHNSMSEPHAIETCAFVREAVAALAATPPASAPDALLREALKASVTLHGLTRRFGTLSDAWYDKVIEEVLAATPPASAEPDPVAERQAHIEAEAATPPTGAQSWEALIPIAARMVRLEEGTPR